MTVTWTSANQARPKDLRADVVVVGSGATGQSVAKQLAKSGVDVMLVEAGPPEVAHRKSQALLAPAMPALHGQYPDFATHLLMSLGGSIGKPQMPMSADGSVDATGIRLAKLAEADLAHWPLDLTDLDPFYDLVSSWFGLDWASHPTPIFDDPRLTAAPFHIVSRLPFSDPTPDHLRGVRVLVDAPVSRLFANEAGPIERAEVTTRKGQTLYVEADQFVLAMNTMPATQLLLNSGLANSSGMVGRNLMDHPLVTFGYIEPSPGLPKSTLEALTPLPTSHGLAWPKLVADQAAVLAGELPNVALSLIPLDWSVRRNLARHRFLKPVKVGARTGAKHSLDRVFADVRSRSISGRTVRDVANCARGIDELAHIKFRPAGPKFNLENGWWRDELGERVGDRLPTTFEIIGMVEQKPDQENRVVLSDERNELGWPRLRVDWRYDLAAREAVDRAATPIIDALADAGFGKIIRLPAKQHTENYSCHHAAGTLRMSADPATGVVDSECRTHDHKNLSIVGTSVFPTVGYANPTMTAMALGARVGARLAS